MPSGPRNVTTGIQHWYKADAIQGLSNGQALAAGIGNAWPVSSGDGHYLPNDSGGAPTWAASVAAINNKLAVQFSGVTNADGSVTSAELDAVGRRRRRARRPGCCSP